MKKLALLLLTICCAANVFAQAGMLRVSSSDHSQVTIALDDRYFHKHGPTLTVGDLPAGKHHIKIYKYTPGNNRNAATQLLYKGKIQVNDSRLTMLLVDVASGNTTITDEAMDENSPMAQNMEKAPAAPEVYQPHALPPDVHLISDTKLDKLKAKVNDKVTDTDKLKTLTSGLKNQSLSTDQVKELMGWLNFENTRLEFVMWAYNEVVDKENFAQLKYEFAYKNSQDDFDKFLNSSK